MLNRDEFVEFLKKEQGDLTDAQFANHIGVSPSFICDVYGGRRDPGDKLAGFFGYKPIRAYQPEKRTGRKP